MQLSAFVKGGSTRLPLPLTFLVLFLIAAAMFSACGDGSKNNGPPVNEPSPSPSPSPSPTPFTSMVGDSIIIIKDGSVDINFVQDYEDDSANKKFVAKDVVL